MRHFFLINVHGYCNAAVRIRFLFPQATVLDLFAGSGQLGLEALSRGAKRAYLIDHSPKALSVIRENVAAAGFSEQAEVIQTEAATFLKSSAPTMQWDLVFLDPPYRHDTIQEMLLLLEHHVAPDGKIICEHERELELPEELGVWRKKKTYIMLPRLPAKRRRLSQVPLPRLLSTVLLS